MRQHLEDSFGLNFKFQSGQLGSCFDVLSGTYTILATAGPMHFFDAIGVNREVHLPVFDQGLFFIICNAGSVGNLIVKTAGGGSTVTTLLPSQSGMFFSGPIMWCVLVGSSGSVGDVISITAIFDNGNTDLSPGMQGDLEIPFSCSIERWTLIAGSVGNLVIDIWKDVYGNFPPTVADSITAAAKPTLVANDDGQSAVLTGWTTTIAGGDTLRFNIDSVSGIKRATLSLKAVKL